ncbi:S26 family signal peptidase [Haloarchaeobius sp. HME9146]|uniref:S26 family signal peptidase n=1 Tax=Haloarchaeobius sp. HME9146 TaxID=2978732 RepID=UPI0021BFE83E|nr:S26 family signal peptidase [Haloarchaeobius sp. HME9146]MCT9094859.1 S26 family signal peptidase [Haloarchaeobius sp. HME9146]
MTGPGNADDPDDADRPDGRDGDPAAPGDDQGPTDEWEWVSDESSPDDADGSEPLGTTPEQDRVVDADADAATPPPQPNGNGDDSEEFDGPIDWFFNTSDPWVQTIRDIGSSVLTVALIGLVLFAVSGVWPPLVAVESGSMEPHMHKNDLVFIVDQDRYAPDGGIEGTGVVTYQHARTNGGYWSFGDYGNVIVYQPYGDVRRTPIIHRAMFYVERGENWYDRANESYLDGADSCAEIANNACPAPHAGFITKGDNQVTNDHYDQVGGQSNIVRPEWVQGKAKVRIPFLGWVRLQFANLASATASTGPATLAGLRLQLGLFAAGLGTVVSRRRGWL